MLIAFDTFSRPVGNNAIDRLNELCSGVRGWICQDDDAKAVTLAPKDVLTVRNVRPCRRKKCFGQLQRVGQIVDVSIVESILAVMESVIAEFSALGAVRQRTAAVTRT
jgi:hypothetical protein